MVSGEYCEGVFPDMICSTRLRNTWRNGKARSELGRIEPKDPQNTKIEREEGSTDFDDAVVAELITQENNLSRLLCVIGKDWVAQSLKRPSPCLGWCYMTKKTDNIWFS